VQSESIDLRQFVGRTFEREGMRVHIDFVSDALVWVRQDRRIAYTVQRPFMRAWLAGAVEVEGEK